MSYIAFLDLLGTKNLSTDDATSYSKSISIFTIACNVALLKDARPMLLVTALTSRLQHCHRLFLRCIPCVLNYLCSNAFL